MSISARQATFSALIRVERDKSFSNIILDSIFSENVLSERDRAFAAGLFYGVLEKRLLLDYNLSRLSQRPINELDDGVLVILQMGLYQLFFMNGVTDAAAVNESVVLCRSNNLNNAAGFVNAVLRAAAKLSEPNLPNIKKGKNKYYSIKYSCPEQIIRLLRNSYGDAETLGILGSADGKAPLTARVNTLKTSTEELERSFKSDGIKTERSNILPDCLFLKNTGDVEKLRQYKDGLFHIQDLSSQLCCRILNPKRGHTVIDACAAPGGKSFTAAELMENEGKIISCDLYESRIGLIRSGASRLGAEIINTSVCDSSNCDRFPMADRVLCDVPCSGLGIIRRKPELRYKADMGFDALPDLQYRILCSCSKFVKSGGLIVYSTCTLNPKENNENARRFLEEHNEFEEYKINLPKGIRRGIEERENELTLFPHINNTDGFFISVFKRK